MSMCAVAVTVAAPREIPDRATLVDHIVGAHGGNQGTRIAIPDPIFSFS